MKTKTHSLRTFLVITASAALLGFAGRAQAADAWGLLGEAQLKAADPSAEIKSQGDRSDKNVKQVKFTVEGADVEVTKLVLMWDNRPDKVITDIGTIKAGGQTAPVDAPGRKTRLKGVKVQYKLVGDAKTATFKVLGTD